MTAGRRIREERLRLEFDQEQIAARCSVKKNTQSRYENDHAVPDLNYLRAFADAGGDALYVVTGKRAYAEAFNEDLLRELVKQSLVVEAEYSSRKIQVANLVSALYRKLAPTLTPNDNVSEKVFFELEALMDIVQKAIPDQPSSSSVEVKGNENRTAGRDYIETKKGGQD